jgi:SAM-dependent methyltransferase
VTSPTRPSVADRPSGGRVIADYAADWESNAQVDARFAILSDPGHGDEWSTAEFLDTGEHEIASVFAHLAYAGAAPAATRRALDFGCGLGRLTRALGRRFDEAVGVDVAPTMVAQAQALDPDPNVSFVVNQSADLACFDDGTFDLVYSNIVLQHVSNDLQRAYLAEFCRVLAPGGLAVFQIPSRRLGVQGTLRRVLPDDVTRRLRQLRRPHQLLQRDDDVLHMEMNCLPEAVVAEVVEAGGATVVDVVFTNAAEPGFAGQVRYFDRDGARVRAGRGGYLSPLYTVRRTEASGQP